MSNGVASTDQASGSFLGTMATAIGVAFDLSKSLGGMAVDAAYAIGGEVARSAGAELVDRGWFGRGAEQPGQGQDGDIHGKNELHITIGVEDRREAGIHGQAEAGAGIHGSQIEPWGPGEAEATANAYARHLEAGPIGLQEMQDVLAHEQRDSEQIPRNALWGEMRTDAAASQIAAGNDGVEPWGPAEGVREPARQIEHETPQHGMER